MVLFSRSRKPIFSIHKVRDISRGLSSHCPYSYYSIGNVCEWKPVKGTSDYEGRRRTLHSSYLVVRSPFLPHPYVVRLRPIPPLLFSRWVKSFTRDITPQPPVTSEDSAPSSSCDRPGCLRVFPSIPPTLPPYVLVAVADSLSFSNILPFFSLSLSLSLSWVHRGSFSPGEKRRKHNIITISKSRFLMSSRGHNVPSPRSFVCRSRCFSRRVVDFPSPSASSILRRGRGKHLTGKLFVARFLILRSRKCSRMCSRSPALLANS